MTHIFRHLHSCYIIDRLHLIILLGFKFLKIHRYLTIVFFFLCPIVVMYFVFSFVFYCCFYFSKVEVKSKKAFNHFQNSNKDKLILF